MKKQTAICKIHKENNIIHLQFNESSILKSSDLNEIDEYINDFYGKDDLPKLIDVRADLRIDEKAKQFLKEQKTQSKITHQAILAGKNTNEEILHVFIGMNSKTTPCRVFTDYDTAVEWLHSTRY